MYDITVWYQTYFFYFAYLLGILFANGESWKELRRFALTTLRDFGMGKRVAEEKILEESRYLIQMFEEHKGTVLMSFHINLTWGPRATYYIKSYHLSDILFLLSFIGKPFDTSCPVNYATSNIISSIVYGSRFEYEDPRFKNLVRRANETIRITGSASIQVSFELALWRGGHASWFY